LRVRLGVGKQLHHELKRKIRSHLVYSRTSVWCIIFQPNECLGFCWTCGRFVAPSQWWCLCFFPFHAQHLPYRILDALLVTDVGSGVEIRCSNIVAWHNHSRFPLSHFFILLFLSFNNTSLLTKNSSTTGSTAINKMDANLIPELRHYSRQLVREWGYMSPTAAGTPYTASVSPYFPSCSSSH
jgi:hypothetical protein